MGTILRVRQRVVSWAGNELTVRYIWSVWFSEWVAFLWWEVFLFCYKNMMSLFAWLSRVCMSISCETDMRLCMLKNQVCTVIWVNMKISWHDCPCPITVCLVWYLSWLCWAWAVYWLARTVIISRVTSSFDWRKKLEGLTTFIINGVWSEMLWLLESRRGVSHCLQNWYGSEDIMHWMSRMY